MIVPNNAEYEETDSNLAQLTILRLHEEIDKLNHIIDKQDRDIVALSNGNNKLKNELEELKLELSGYRQAILQDKEMLGLKERIDKANEYINEYLETTEYGEIILTHTFDKHNLKELRDILGSDKE